MNLRTYLRPIWLTIASVGVLRGALAAPPNDYFTNRIAIALPSDHFVFDILGATNEVGEPLPMPQRNQTLWWKVTPTYDGIMAIGAQASLFPLSLGVYTGSNLAGLTLLPALVQDPLAPGVGCYYQLQAGLEYAVQISANYPAGGEFSLDTRYYNFTNDMFANATHLEGTNLSYEGVFVGATLEPGEPITGATNTVWASWTAPFSGSVRYSLATAPNFQYLKVYSGSSLTNLQAVPTSGLGNGVSGFLGIEGTNYHFQISGGAYAFSFSLVASPLGPCTNDNFGDAPLVEGNVIYYPPYSVMGATMELGEPAHLGPVPQKSVWWKWQAPQNGNCYVAAGASSIPGVLLAAYVGDTVDTLALVAKATNSFQFQVTGGTMYHFAGVVPADAVGEILLFSQSSGSLASRPVPGNLLREGSWEGTAVLDAQYWHWTGSLGGYVNEPGGADGSTWPTATDGTVIWQDFTTVSGRQHRLRFAYRLDPNSCCGGSQVRAYWDATLLQITDVSDGQGIFWRWKDYTVFASNTTSRISFEVHGRGFDMDAFSVVDLTAPPAIVTQPASISTLAGGTAAFTVGATGSSPLAYQWHFNGAPLNGATARQLILDNASTNQTGSYLVVVTNAFGAVTSSPATLFVEAPVYPTIVWQPYGDTVPAGGYFSFSVVAVGAEPLDYQWTFNGSFLSEETNKALVFTNVWSTNAGAYAVKVHNSAGTVWSIPASLLVNTSSLGGGMIAFQNKFNADTNIDAPVFDVDGTTRLSGGNFLAQLYAGPSLELLRPADFPSAFRTGLGAGYVVPRTITLANVLPGENTTVQIRAWDALKGNSYEEVRALGGRFGKSEILTVPAGGGTLYPPQFLLGLQSFSLQAGLPRFASGVIQFAGSGADGSLIWNLTGEAGYRYLVEKSLGHFIWHPFVVVTNLLGTVTFTDSPTNESSAVYYRARVLD